MIKAIFVDAGGVLFLNKNGVGYLNKPLLNFIETNQTRYTFVIISTTNYDLEETLEKSEVRNLFKAVLTSGATGMRKDEVGIYKTALSITKVNPEEVIFIDNEQSYLDAASLLGIKTILYNDADLCLEKIEQLVIN
jgi:putative hydrolase of the HAD superfamily